MSFSVSTFTHTVPSPRAKSGIALVSKRYCWSDHSTQTQGLTLLFLHGTGSHKESWEPVIEPLLRLRGSSGKAVVREAWAIEWPSHGESSLVNAEALKGIQTMHDVMTINEWATQIKSFVATGIFQGHTLVGIGHSAGATTTVLTTMPSADGFPPVPYHSMILIEPTLMTPATVEAHPEQYDIFRLASFAISKRRDVWASRAEAREYFQKRIPWKMWDKRVMELLIHYGLKDIPHPKREGERAVTLCCSKLQEEGVFTPEYQYAAAEWLGALDPTFPVHFVLASEADLIPEEVQEENLAIRKLASVQKIPETGHFVVQDQPDALAAALGKILNSNVQARL